MAGQIPGTNIPYAAPMSRLAHPKLSGIGVGQFPSLSRLNLAGGWGGNLPSAPGSLQALLDLARQAYAEGNYSALRTPRRAAPAPTIATTGGYQPGIATTGGYQVPAGGIPGAAASPLAAAAMPTTIPPLADAMFTASASAMRKKLQGLPSIRALYGGRTPPWFQAPGSPMNMPELGLYNVPMPWQAAAQFQRSSPYDQQQLLDLWQAGSIPPLYALASIMAGTPGNRFNPIQAPVRWF